MKAKLNKHIENRNAVQDNNSLLYHLALGIVKCSKPNKCEIFNGPSGFCITATEIHLHTMPPPDVHSYVEIIGSHMMNPAYRQSTISNFSSLYIHPHKCKQQSNKKLRPICACDDGASHYYDQPFGKKSGCRKTKTKTKTKVITLADRNRCKQHNEPNYQNSKQIHVTGAKPGKTRAAKSGASFVNQSQSVAMQNQSKKRNYFQQNRSKRELKHTLCKRITYQRKGI